MKINFIGPVSPPYNGPGIKNQILVNELKFKGIQVNVLNTLSFKNRLISFFKTLCFFFLKKK